MKSSLSVSDLQKRILPVLVRLRTYAAFIFVLVFLGVYVYMVNYIGNLIQDEPSQAAIDSKLKPVNRLKIDQKAVEQINELEAQSIEVKALFDQARQNPFTE